MGTTKPNSTQFSIPELAKASADEKEAVVFICEIASKLTGVQLGERQQGMIASRLHKRLADLKLTSLREYLDYYRLNSEKEAPKLISLATTHHTFFFREFSHFEYISEKLLPAILPELKARPDKTLHIWAAACSRGQEVYSLAMYLDFHLKLLDSSLKFKILGTDIDSESVQIAKNGVYLRNELKEAPLTLLGNHWSKGTGEIEAFVKVKASLRDHCNFSTLNLLNLNSSTPLPGGVQKFDFIFCRNVFIYFNPSQIKQISQELLNRLGDQGYLFIGVSESLNGLGLTASPEGPSIYAKKKKAIQLNHPSLKSPIPATVVVKHNITVAKTGPIRVLCVDDSPSILAIMKKILTPDLGFEIIGTAINGIDAAEKVKVLKPDVMTLDIHMPEQNGIEYLEKNFRSGHPPVMMVTSVSREDSGLAGRALQLGASDYVEKPALTNMTERGDEIRAKLKFLNSIRASSGSKAQFDQAFMTEKKFQSPENKLRIVVASLAQREKLKAFLKDFKGNQPPCVILFEGAKNILPDFAKTLGIDTSKTIQYLDEFKQGLKVGEIYVGDLSSCMSTLQIQAKNHSAISISVFGEVSKSGSSRLTEFAGAHLVIEDLGNGNGTLYLKDIANEIVPFTTFSYASSEFFFNSENKTARAA